VPVEASFDYYTSSCGQISAGLWTCTAHETTVDEYPVHEFIFLLEGSIILTVDGEEHVFEAGDAFFIPQGLKCATPTAALCLAASLGQFQHQNQLQALCLTQRPDCRCSWRQPTALKKCYIVYTPVEPEAGAKL
jgi:hypothetical protein